MMTVLVAWVWGPTSLSHRIVFHSTVGGETVRSSVMDNGAQRPPGNNNQGQGARNHNPVLHVRDRLFHALFYRIAITYARAFPRPVRRVLEFAILVKVRCDQKKVRVLAVLLLLLLLLFSFALKVKEVEFRSSKQSKAEWTFTCTIVFLECEYDLQYSTKS